MNELLLDGGIGLTVASQVAQGEGGLALNLET